MSTGVQTPITVFSLGLGPLIGAAAEGISAGVTAGTEAVNALTPVVTAGVEAATAGVQTITAGAGAAAEAIGTTAPMIANVVGDVAAPLATQASSLVSPVGESLMMAAKTGIEGGTQVASQIANPLAEATSAAIEPGMALTEGGSQVPGMLQGSTEAVTKGLMQTASSGMTPSQVMAQFSGPQMSSVPASQVPNFAAPAANMSTAGGPVFSAPTSMPTATETASTSWRDNPWVKKGGKALKSLGKSALSQSSQDGGQKQQSSAGPQYAQAPPPDPYVSSHRSEHMDQSQSVMNDYLSSGGAFYG